MLMRHRSSQHGFVMVVSLIVLVILTLAAVGLIRTVSTSSSIAGNLAFEQAAATSADRSIEAAVAWLENNTGQASSPSAVACLASVGATVLACDQGAAGYAATRIDPGSNQTWAALWTQLTSAGITPVNGGGDVAGNTTAYLIQRMCTAVGDASSTNGCSVSPLSLDMASSRKAGSTAVASSGQAYYRITVRVSGPRNTLSFTQAMVAL